MESTHTNSEFRLLVFADGKYRLSHKNAVAGFCHCHIHKGYLDVGLVKSHNCIEKECRYLQKFDDAPYWKHIENKKKIKQQRKDAKKRRQSDIERKQAAVENRMDSLMNKAQSIADKLGYDIIITRAVPRSESKENYEYILNYVSDNDFDDWYMYFDLAVTLGKSIGGKYILKHMRYPDGRYVSIENWLSVKSAV